MFVSLFAYTGSEVLSNVVRQHNVLFYKYYNQRVDFRSVYV